MATIGTLVGAQCQDTTTTTGTGAITLANAVPAGAPAGSTTFGAQFAPGAVFPVNNIFYVITDGTNFEVGLGTLTSATNLTRDYVLGSYTGAPALTTQTGGGGHVNFAAGTKQVFSNTNLFATTVAVWQRIPDDNAANIFNAVMSGTFTGQLTINAVGTNCVVRFKVTNEGYCILSFTATTQNQAGTTVTITGIPAFLTNLAATINVIGLVTSNSVTVLGLYQIASGATPTSTGVITLQQSTGVSPIAFTGTFTSAVPNGVPTTAIGYPLF